MSQEAGEDVVISPSALIAGGCFLACLIGFFLPSAPSVHSSEAKPISSQTTTTATPEPTVAASPAEPRVTFAPTMPRFNGTQIYENNGLPNPFRVMVAIPDGPKSVRFVKGNDPAAVRYLAAQRSEQKRVTFDRGPSEVDTSTIVDFGPLKGRAPRRAGNLAADTPPQPTATDSTPPGTQ